MTSCMIRVLGALWTCSVESCVLLLQRDDVVHEVSDGQAARHDKGSLQRHGNPPPAFAGEEPCEVTIDAGKVERDFSSAVRYAGVGQKRKK